MPRFIMLCGPSCSGKSTFRAKLIQHNPQSIVISSDDILEEWAKADGLTYQEAFELYRHDTARLMEDIVGTAFDMDKEIIWDQTNLTHAARRKRLDTVPDSYDKVAVGFKTPLPMLLDRSHIRAVNTGKTMPEDIIIQQFKQFEFPDFDDGFDNIVQVSEPGNVVTTL